MADIRNIPIRDIERNRGQLAGVKKNPRVIHDQKFDKLKRSIEENPEMLELREILVFPHGAKFIAIGGNMRLESCKALGYKEVPCKVIPADTPAETLNAYIIKDNSGFGDWDWDALANEWDEKLLDDWGVDCWQPEEAMEDPTELDNESGLKPFSIKITFKSEGQLQDFRRSYEQELASKYKDATISVSGGGI